MPARNHHGRAPPRSGNPAQTQPKPAARGDEDDDDRHRPRAPLWRAAMISPS